MNTAATHDTSAPAPWIARQLQQLVAQRGHAWLLHGPSGLGQYRLALALAQAWLCESPTPHGACGQCASCHAIQVRTHADLCVLMPETILLAQAWPLGEKARSEIDKKERKPSKEIRIDAMREAVDFCQRTSARGRGKVVLVFPAETMNTITANALLKTLEEPAGDVRFVLATESAHQLLPTIRSRCIGHTLQWPSHAQASAWLLEQGLPPGAIDPALKAAGDRPEDALLLSQNATALQAWHRIPTALRQGDATVWKDWAPAMQLDAAHKLCHDLLVQSTGAVPRFFDSADLHGLAPDFATLSAWSRQLSQAMRSIEHPFNPGLLTEALVSQAQSVLNSGKHPRS